MNIWNAYHFLKISNVKWSLMFKNLLPDVSLKNIFEEKNPISKNKAFIFTTGWQGISFRVFLYQIHESIQFITENIWKIKITVTFVKDPLCFMNALLSVIITSQTFLFRKKIQSCQIDEFVKNCSIIYICLTTQLLYQKNKFYMCSLLFKANFYVAHALLAQISSNFFCY